MDIKKWQVDDDNNISFQVDEHHKFCIESLADGFILRFFDERGTEQSSQPLQLYRAKLSFAQLGYWIK